MAQRPPAQAVEAVRLLVHQVPRARGVVTAAGLAAGAAGHSRRASLALLLTQQHLPQLLLLPALWVPPHLLLLVGLPVGPLQHRPTGSLPPQPLRPSQHLGPHRLKQRPQPPLQQQQQAMQMHLGRRLQRMWCP